MRDGAVGYADLSLAVPDPRENPSGGRAGGRHRRPGDGIWTRFSSSLRRSSGPSRGPRAGSSSCSSSPSWPFAGTSRASVKGRFLRHCC